MKKILPVLFVLAFSAFAGIGCSTTAHLKLPPNTTLEVTDRAATPDANGVYNTSPFFWSSTGGANYKLKDKNGNVIKTGKLKTHFRVVSIFWPPAALIYWPMGFQDGIYDLTNPDGTMVTVDSSTPASHAASHAAPAAKAPATKDGKKKKN